MRAEGMCIIHSSPTRPDDEGKTFRDFISFLKKHNDYVIYHWHNYEHWHMKRLAERHNLVEEADEFVLSRMVDLHKVATRAFAFPTYTNGLKDIAAYLGFKWRHVDINALDAIAYYLKYQTDPDGYREKIYAVIDYNEDDCRATRAIKDWLVGQKSVLLNLCSLTFAEIGSSHICGNVVHLNISAI